MFLTPADQHHADGRSQHTSISLKDSFHRSAGSISDWTLDISAHRASLILITAMQTYDQNKWNFQATTEILRGNNESQKRINVASVRPDFSKILRQPYDKLLRGENV